MGFFADFLHLSLISPGGNYIESETVTWDDERSSEAAMGGAQHRLVRDNEQKKNDVLYVTVLGMEGGGAFKGTVVDEVAIS
jgi:hypothetical protein